MKRNDHHLIQQVLDAEVSREEFDAFQGRLRNEPDLMRLYGDYALLQHTLCEEFEGGGATGLHLLEPPRKNARVPTVIAIAAVLALMAVVFISRPWVDHSATDDVALVTFSVDSVWKIEGSSRSIGGATGVGGGSVLQLTCGRAGISLSPTVTAIVEGPAELTFRSRDSIFMETGKGYFTVAGNGGGLNLETPRGSASNFNAEFGIEIPADGAEEILVSQGEMRIVSKTGGGETLLAAGDAAQIPGNGQIARFPADDRRFAKALGRFRSVLSGASEGIQWNAVNETAGEVHTRFLRLPEAVPSTDSSVLLTTLEMGSEQADGGWSFMSFLSNGNEVLQFGDSAKETSAAVILPERPDNSLRTVTLRYDQRTGDVSLHEGGLPLGNLICSGKIAPGTEFDGIRVGASSAEALAVNSLDIRVGLE